MKPRFLAIFLVISLVNSTISLAQEAQRQGHGPSKAKSETYTFHYDQLLGTSGELRVTCDSPEAADSIEKTVINEIDRLTAILSSYDPQSEFSNWSASGSSQPQKVSTELFKALASAETWNQKSSGAFSATAEVVSKLWKDAAKTGQLPIDLAKKAAIQKAAMPAWKLDVSRQTAARLGDTPITLDALAEGQIIDAVVERVRHAHPQVKGLLLNLGGDIGVFGEMTHTVAIADPAHSAENARPLCRAQLQNQSLVTSGGYHKGSEIAGRWYSHIVDPRTGKPTGHVRSASVIAAKAIDADALATILCVLPIDEGLALIEKHAGAECFIVDAQGGLHSSSGWSKYELPSLERSQFTSTPISEDAKFDLEIEVEINKPGAARGYRRPYVAVWIEDKDNLPVRTIAVWTQRGGPGPRWLPDLKKWYKSDQLRKLADGTEIIDTVSSATKAPGKYKLIWNGLDDAGKPVKPGKYTLFIEAAREHGTYQVIRSQQEFGDKPFKSELKGNEEIKGVTLDYRQSAATSK